MQHSEITKYQEQSKSLKRTITQQQQVLSVIIIIFYIIIVMYIRIIIMYNTFDKLCRLISIRIITKIHVGLDWTCAVGFVVFFCNTLFLICGKFFTRIYLIVRFC